MLKGRTVLYLKTNLSEKNTVSTGIEFEEFIKSLETPLNNILLLKHNYHSCEFHVPTQFGFVKREHVDEFSKEDVYSYGDFCWVDFKDETSLDHLRPQEIAELLYLGHLMKPLGFSFSDKLKNRFAYIAHDDGWRNEIYYSNLKEFVGVISKLIPLKLKKVSRKRNIPDIPISLANRLYNLSVNGLLLDFNRIARSGHIIELPVHLVEHINDFDQIYNDIDQTIGQSQYKCWLVFNNGTWDLKENS